MMGFAACALILSSCAQNELLDGPQSPNNDGKIKFSAVSSLGSTRAATGHPLDNTAALRTLGAFKVQGYGTAAPIAGLEYVNATVNWRAATQSWEYSSEPFWPAQALNFYAYAPTTLPAGTASIANASGVTVTDFTVGDNDTQVDLVVASALGKTKEDRTPLLFKHALTQIVFKTMTVTGSKLNVQIASVDIVNINNKGTFKSTANPAADYPQSYWAPEATSSYTTYNASPAAAVKLVAGGATEGAVGTTTAAVAIKKDAADNNQLLMIPQNFTAWDTKTSILANDAGTKKAYIKLTAAIWTKVETATGSGIFKNVALHGEINADDENGIKYATIYIPVASLNAAGTVAQDGGTKAGAPLGQWVPGRRINYIITFGDTGSGSGGGGYTEDPTDPSNPDIPPVQVLVPIKFTAEVEDWVDQDVPLLTATFTGTSSAVDATFINGYTNNLLNDLSGAIVPKKYNANISIGGKLKEATTITLTGYNETSGADFKYLPGTTITYDFKKTGSELDFDSKTIAAAAPTGWTISATSIDGTTDKTSIVLTRSAWSTADIKLSVEKRAASAVYTTNDDANGLNLSSWAPLYLTPNQTFSIDFGAATGTAPTTGANWVWDGPNKRATYVQPYHAATILELETLLEGTPINGYTYYIKMSATGTTDLSSVTPNVSSGKKVYVVFMDGVLTGSTLGTDWTISTADPKVAIYTKP